MTITLPLVGVLTANVQLAEFQYNPTNSSLFFPHFDNPTGGGAVAEYGCIPANGIYGLTSYYQSICPWDGAAAGNNGAYGVPYGSTPVQFATSTLNSYGVFDFDATLPNPAEYHPVATSIPYQGQNYGAVTFIGYRVVQTGAGANSTGTFNVKIPSVLYENVRTSLSAGSPWQYQSSNAYGVVQYTTSYLPVQGFYSPDQRLYGDNLYPCLQSIQNYPSEFDVLVDPGYYSSTWYTDIYTYPPSSMITNQAGGRPLPWSNVLVRNVFGQGDAIMNVGINDSSLVYAGQLVNPFTGWCIFVSHTLGAPWLRALNIYQSTDPVTFQPNKSSYTVYTEAQALVFEEDADNNGLILGTAPNYVGTMIPGGAFLIRKNVYVSGQPQMLMVLNDLSGYVQVYLNGNTSAANDAILGGEFGVDLDGNFWFMTPSYPGLLPLLYSTFNLQKTLTFPDFPPLSAVAVGCRFLGGASKFVWEG